MFEVARQNYGEAYVANMKQVMNQQTTIQNNAYIQYTAQQMVQQSAPCNNMAQKAFYQWFE